MNIEVELYCDFAQELLRGTHRLLDERIVKMAAWVTQRQDADPEIAGFYADEIDYLIGLGFVAGQRYITSTRSYWKLPKDQALNMGPYFGSTSIGYAAIVNAAANYWKHHEEWDNSALNPNAKHVVDILTKIRVDWRGSFVVMNTLQALGVKTLMELAPQLETWHANVMEIQIK